MNLLPYGDTAVLLSCESLDEARRWHAAIETEVEGYDDLVMGAESVLVRTDRERVAAIRAAIGDLRPPASVPPAIGSAVEIPTRYDGPDLEAVATHTGLSHAEVIAAHTACTWTVAFGGFAPGFVYLTGEDERLHMPRRSSPRTRIPAGSVGLAGAFSGVYPRESPGGWQLIGHTDMAMWDLDRDPPAALLPGHQVRFVESS